MVLSNIALSDSDASRQDRFIDTATYLSMAEGNLYPPSSAWSLLYSTLYVAGNEPPSGHATALRSFITKFTSATEFTWDTTLHWCQLSSAQQPTQLLNDHRRSPQNHSGHHPDPKVLVPRFHISPLQSSWMPQSRTKSEPRGYQDMEAVVAGCLPSKE